MGLKRRVNPHHLSGSGERYTPAHVAEGARAVMGGIDLDPASCARANEIVKATKYYTRAENGLRRPMSGRVILNAPGSCKDAAGTLTDCYQPPRTDGTQKQNCSCNLVSRFWGHLLGNVAQGNVPVAVWVGFHLNQLQSLQTHHEVSPLSFITCFPRKRLRYLDTKLQEMPSPPQASYITLVVPNVEQARARHYRHRFCGTFGPLGRITLPGESHPSWEKILAENGGTTER